ncbi:Quinone oxidoreductase [Labilithrix luteola]|uniref:Quinone oxidoreductase n=1 Tax=Labilithrix luteola TaxID=1391654 RepID=A0A0K1PWJ7_9BACT|nr:zinc-binding dehydrogenase [Labilithrix luteola]AKU97903.1 Quinone oxidoreductase [Labilithrix luteola]
MSTMKVIEGASFGGADVLKLKEVSSPATGTDALLIDVRAAGVNYLDLVTRAGFLHDAKTPFRLGFEVAGVVKEVGAGVTNWMPGDAVAAILPGGGYASQVVVPASAAIPIPTGIGPSLAAALLVQGLTAFLTLEVGKVRPGANVLVSAAGGGVGALAVQIAKLQGANVIGLASRAKHDFVRKNGADHVVDYRSPGWSSSLREVVGDRGVDLLLDSIGDLQTEAAGLLGTGAHWIVYGSRAESQRPLPAEALWPMIEKNVTLRGFNLEGCAEHFPRALGQIFDWATSGRLKVETRTYPLAQAALAHQHFEGRETVGKVLLIP